MLGQRSGTIHPVYSVRLSSREPAGQQMQTTIHTHTIDYYHNRTSLSFQRPTTPIQRRLALFVKLTRSYAAASLPPPQRRDGRANPTRQASFQFSNPPPHPPTPQEELQMAFSGICKLSFAFLAHSAGFVCAGMPLMSCGHFFLKLSHAPEYQDATFTSSLQVGALGGFLMTIPMMILEWMIKNFQSCSFSLPKSSSSNNAEKHSIAESQGTDAGATAKETPIAKNENKGSDLPFSIGLGIIQVLFSIGSVVGLGAGAGYFGSSVLIATGHDVLGVLAATRAGAVGASILGPGALVAVVVLCTCCGGTAFLAVMFAQAMGTRGSDEESKMEAEKTPDANV